MRMHSQMVLSYWRCGTALCKCNLLQCQHFPCLLYKIAIIAYYWLNSSSNSSAFLQRNTVNILTHSTSKLLISSSCWNLVSQTWGKKFLSTNWKQGSIYAHISHVKHEWRAKFLKGCLSCLYLNSFYILQPSSKYFVLSMYGSLLSRRLSIKLSEEIKML